MHNSILRRFVDHAANVVFEGIDTQWCVGREEGLQSDRVGGIELAGDVPGQAVERVHQALEVGRAGDGRTERESAHIENLRLGGKNAILQKIRADDDVIRVQGLGDADGSGAGGLKGQRQAQAVERVESVPAADAEKSGGVQAAIENVRRGFADPVQIEL